MKKSLLFIGVVLLSGCSQGITPEEISDAKNLTCHSREEYEWSKKSLTGGTCLYLPGCEALSWLAISGNYYGACYVKFWDNYKKCFGGIPTGTGCVLMKGQIGKPECYKKNCPEQYR